MESHNFLMWLFIITLCGFFIICCSYYIMLCDFFIMCCSRFITFCGFFMMSCNAVLYPSPCFIHESVFYTQSMFYTQSVVRSPCFILIDISDYVRRSISTGSRRSITDVLAVFRMRWDVLKEEKDLNNVTTSIHHDKTTPYNEVITQRHDKNTSCQDCITRHHEETIKRNEATATHNEEATQHNVVTTTLNEETTQNNGKKTRKKVMAFHSVTLFKCYVIDCYVMLLISSYRSTC